ncbi:MAG: GntR family transcriptional regulator [Oscillospiraceae bacterium]|nr:GntR family transcriptional regulator [Oscillospiraceae bacterium]
MKAILDGSKSIFIQICEAVEDGILTGEIGEEQPVPSTNQFAKHFSINPATAAKGVNLLVDEGIIYKKRGIGMFVAAGAREKIRRKRKQAFIRDKLNELLSEAEKLDISKAEIIEIIEREM